MKKQQPVQHRKYPKSDKIVFLAGILLTVLAVTLFAWRMAERLQKEADESTGQPTLLEQSVNAGKSQAAKESK